MVAELSLDGLPLMPCWMLAWLLVLFCWLTVSVLPLPLFCVTVAASELEPVWSMVNVWLSPVTFTVTVLLSAITLLPAL